MIYSVEDDTSIRELICYALESQGFECQGFGEPSSFLEALEKSLPELILLDVMLPETDGISLLKKLKSNAKTADIPVIMVSAKDSEFDKVTGLDLGADDYIAKPFGMMELISRVKSVLRRVKRAEVVDVLSFNGIVIDLKQFKVYSNDEEVSLTYKEFNLLKYLIKNANIVMSRDKLIYKVWETEENIESRTLDVHIKTLRQKLGANGECIQTVRGVGYVVR